MQIQRYLQKEASKGAYFGKHSQEHTQNFEWFIGKNKIGVYSNNSIEADSFIEKFLIEKDRMIISFAGESPLIARERISSAYMSGIDSGIEQVLDLIKLIQKQETTHAFITSEKEDGTNGNILTFSQNSPPSKLYSSGKIMPIYLHD